MNYIKLFKNITLQDVPTVGGKNASLGQMISSLSAKEIRIPDGFAITASAYWHYLESNNRVDELKKIMGNISADADLDAVNNASQKIRTLIESGKMPADLAQEISDAYQALCKEYRVTDCAVAVRSSATAEDLPTRFICRAARNLFKYKRY